jgi:hypothetical protein
MKNVKLYVLCIAAIAIASKEEYQRKNIDINCRRNAYSKIMEIALVWVR